MLKKHIIDALSKGQLSVPQKQQLSDLLLSIKHDEALLAELVDTDTLSLRTKLTRG